jgi:hypothetical protein
MPSICRRRPGTETRPDAKSPRSGAINVKSLEARASAQAGLALDPDFTIRRFRATAPSDNPTFVAGRERISDGMRMAGIPEG